MWRNPRLFSQFKAIELKCFTSLLKTYTVNGYGCIGSQARVDKLKEFSESKFCIAMENRCGYIYIKNITFLEPGLKYIIYLHPPAAMPKVMCQKRCVVFIRMSTLVFFT